MRDDRESPQDGRTSARRVGWIVAAACIGQGLLCLLQPLPAADAGQYARTAEQFVREGVGPALRDGDFRPLFALWIAAIRMTLSACGAAEWFGEGAVLLGSVRLAAIVPLVGAAWPLARLLRRRGSETLTLSSVAIFLLLPRVARLGPDGVRDPLYLFLILAGIAWFDDFLESCRTADRPLHCAPLGWSILACGLAAQVRTEACVVCPFVCVALLYPLLRQAFAAGGLPGDGPLRRGAFGAIAVCGGAFLTTSALDFGTAWATAPAAATAEVRGDLAFEFRDATRSSRLRGTLPALGETLKEWAELLGPIVLPAGIFLGLRLRRVAVRLRAGRQIEWWFGTAALLGLVWLHAAREGYVGDRHLLLTAVPIAVGAAWTGLVVGRRRGRLHGRIVFAGIAVASLAVLSFPMNASREGRRAAGLRMREIVAAEPAGGTAMVLDTRMSSVFFSGLPTVDYRSAPAGLADPRLRFFVVDQAEIESPGIRGATLRALLSAAGRERFRVRPKRPGTHPARETACVFDWNPARAAAFLAGELGTNSAEPFALTARSTRSAEPGSSGRGPH